MDRRRVVAAGAALAAAATGAVMVPALAHSAVSGCTASYEVVSSWSGGFQGQVTVTNPGSTTITAWTAAWSFGSGQSVSQAWNATVTQSGSAVTATNVAWNGSVPPGASTSFGFLGTGTGPAPAVSCSTPGGTSPTPSATTGSPSPSVSASASRSASASASPSRSVSPSASSSPPPPAGCTGAVFCDGFENQAGGTISGLWNVSFVDCQGSGTATVDTAVAHGGGKSARIDGKAGYCNHVMVKPSQDLSRVGSVWYARFYVRHSTALPAAHVTFAALKDTADGGRDLRMGGQNGALQWNRQSDDATLPAQSPVGVSLSKPLPTGGWNCVEFMVDTRGLLSTWLDGSAITGLTVDGTPTADVDQQWLNRTWRPQPTDLRLGWESYGNGDDTLWFDDVAVGTTRIGC